MASTHEAVGSVAGCVTKEAAVAQNQTMAVRGLKPGKVLLVGEAMGLFTAGEEGPCSRVGVFHASVAGAELNVAIGLKRLGHDPLYATKLGNDVLGERIMYFMQDNGLDATSIEMDDSCFTGFMMKSKETHADPKTYYFRKNSAASTIDGDFVRSIDWDGVSVLHLTGILPALSSGCLQASYDLIGAARERGVFVSFDPNLRPSLWANMDVMRATIRELAAKADLVLPGVAEGRMLFGADCPQNVADAFLTAGATCVIVKDGPNGAYAANSEQSAYVPGFVVDHVVDTVGCGDGFAAGVLSSLMEGNALPEAAERGCAIGAIQTQSVSDNEGLPDVEELSRFMASHDRVNGFA